MSDYTTGTLYRMLLGSNEDFELAKVIIEEYYNREEMKDAICEARYVAASQDYPRYMKIVDLMNHIGDPLLVDTYMTSQWTHNS